MVFGNATNYGIIIAYIINEYQRGYVDIRGATMLCALTSIRMVDIKDRVSLFFCDFRNILLFRSKLPPNAIP